MNRAEIANELLMMNVIITRVYVLGITLVDNWSWHCDFDNPDGSSTWCRMFNELASDDFDWTMQRGGTPSEETGPDQSYNGNYYIYIEASSPRRPNDKAV